MVKNEGSFTDCTHLMMCDPQPFSQLSRKVCCALDTETKHGSGALLNPFVLVVWWSSGE